MDQMSKRKDLTRVSGVMAETIRRVYPQEDVEELPARFELLLQRMQTASPRPNGSLRAYSRLRANADPQR